MKWHVYSNGRYIGMVHETEATIRAWAPRAHIDPTCHVVRFEYAWQLPTLH